MGSLVNRVPGVPINGGLPANKADARSLVLMRPINQN